MQNLDAIFHQSFPVTPISDGFFYQPRALANSPSFTLLDSGYGEKFEMVGDKKFIRPEPQAMWQPAAENNWQVADARFKTSAEKNMKSEAVRELGKNDLGSYAGGEEERNANWGRWQLGAGGGANLLHDKWRINHFGVDLTARLTAFRHYGFFPEQALFWKDMQAIIDKLFPSKPTALNLFAYSGMASLFLANQGVNVVHVDASKKAVAYAEENIARDKGVKLLIDDAITFVRREVRRGNRYNIILLDPPKFGRGPKGESWEIWQDLPELLALLPSLLVKDQPAAIFLTVYAIRASCFAIGRSLQEAFNLASGEAAGESSGAGNIYQTTFGELCLTEQARGFYIPQAIYAVHQTKS